MPKSGNILTKILFRTILIILPLLILGLIELMLYIAGYGNNYSLFVEDNDQPDYVYFNPNISKKYFSIQQNATQGLYEPFKKQKDETTFRIFALGGSTAIGFPYKPSGSFHNMLSYRVQRSFPEKTIEVINISLTAINSVTILDFSKQLIKYEPDAILIYMGHNEYYGALGVGSTSNLGIQKLVKVVLALRNLRLFQLIDNIIQNLRNVDPNLTDYSKTLMERMVSQKEIPLDSKEYQAGVEQFQSNLKKIFSIFGKNNIPVFCSTLVCNYKDQEPFISSNPKPVTAKEFNFYFEKGLNHFYENSYDSAYIHLTKANHLDSSVASGHYQLAKTAYSLGYFKEAKAEYIAAKDLDLLRFRAPESINSIIIDEAGNFENVTLVDTRKYFENFSPGEIIGNELITEHLHPNLEGYWLMSVAFFNALKQKNVISNDWSNVMADNDFRREVPITKLDSLYGAYQVKMLRELWPFNEERVAHDTTGLSFEEKVAGGLAVKTINWKDGVKTLFDYYIQNNRFYDALKLFESQIYEYPFRKEMNFQIAAGLAEKASDYNLATYYYRRLFRIKPTFESAQGALTNLLRMDKPGKTLEYCDFIVNETDQGNNFIPLMNIINQIIDLQAKYKYRNDIDAAIEIAKLYEMIGNYMATEKYIEIILSEVPDNTEAKKLQKKLMNRQL